MSLSEARIREIVLGYLQREARRNRQPRQTTVREARQLQTWLVIFWLNQDLQARISKFLRLGGGLSGRRRADMRDYLTGRDQETDKYEDKGLQVSLISRPGAIQVMPSLVLSCYSLKPEHKSLNLSLTC